MVVAAVEAALLFGKLSALVAALFDIGIGIGIGIPKDSA